MGAGAVAYGQAHIANAAHRSGNSLPEGVIMEQFRADSAASETFGRMVEHLRDNGVDLKKTPLKLGGWLDRNPGSSRFVSGPGFEVANTLYSRRYREPFVVPEIG